MKRLNPKTNKPFKFGEECPEASGKGRLFFYNYRTDILANGFRGERWLSLEAFERAVKRDLAAKAKKRRQAGKQVRVFKVTPAHV